jgi:hypothetical protein
MQLQITVCIKGKPSAATATISIDCLPTHLAANHFGRDDRWV